MTVTLRCSQLLELSLQGLALAVDLSEESCLTFTPPGFPSLTFHDVYYVNYGVDADFHRDLISLIYGSGGQSSYKDRMRRSRNPSGPSTAAQVPALPYGR